ncbi:hypothetical protein EK21DRAFT_107940 [Setomelanomma holmii]|uniref:Uncharacterized protein n=1 Tax=Setomelanomma holmii TaxID=210430 RepID=A0A9P4HG20_9PLEO|nr:hypothetical protein EK21DRAFT_107940 [Setomelanomma holmii]
MDTPTSSSTSIDLVITPTPTPTPTPVCFAYPDSYVRNGGFERGTPGWTYSQTPSAGPWNFTDVSATGVYCYYGSEHSGDCELSGKTQTGSTGRSDGTMSLKQTDIHVASGTQVQVTGWVRPTRGPKNSNTAPYTFTLMFDSTVVATYTPNFQSSSTSPYVQLTNTVTVSGDGPHTLSLLIRTKGTANTFIYDADDFSVTVVKAPGNQQLCDSSTGPLSN